MQDYIYLADHTQYFSGTTGTTSYRLRVITKAGAQFRSLKHRSRVRALAVYSDREEASPGDGKKDYFLLLNYELQAKNSNVHVDRSFTKVGF